jgi:hypothetical protein
MMAPRAKRVQQAPPEDVGPVRYTQERLFWGIDSDTVKALKQVWKDGEQLATEAIPDEAICCVIMLAAWGRRFGVDLVDDYEVLLQRARDGMLETRIHHPDLYFVSCACILYQRNEEPTIGGFEQIGIPAHYEALIGGSDE